VADEAEGATIAGEFSFLWFLDRCITDFDSDEFVHSISYR